jgi:SAM-dependent methyltransferase
MQEPQMTITDSGLSRRSIEQLLFLQEAAAATAALEAANRLGVLARLSAGPTPPSAVARDCAISERGARLLLAALAGLGLAEAGADGCYRASALTDWSARSVPWVGLTETIRDDHPIVAGDTPAGAEVIYPDVVPYLGTIFASAAERVADRLAAPGLRVLDVGAGAAPWSLALAACQSDCQITAVDLPAVLLATQQAVTAAGRAAQFRYLGGDLFAVEWGIGIYDLVVAGNVCHLFDEAANRRLLARLFDALRPGGTLAILDALPNERLDGPRPVVLYALGLLLRTTSGCVYPFTTYVGWLRDAGYDSIERAEIAPGPLISLVTARRP